MKTMRQWRYAATALLASLLLAGPATAAPGDAGTVPFRVAQSGGLTLGQAIAQVRRRYDNARIVSAETRVSGGREVHIIKVLTKDGTVKTERIPGRRVDSGRG